MRVLSLVYALVCFSSSILVVDAVRKIYAPKIPRLWDCSKQEIRPVFIKFHKVGGESVRDYFFENVKYEKTYYHWNSRSCPGLPVEHPTLQSYTLHGGPSDSSQFKTCVLPKACPEWPIDLVTTIRDPLKRFVSGINYFPVPQGFFPARKGSSSKGLKYDNPKDIVHPQEMALFKILTKPMSVSVSEMSGFLDYVDKRKFKVGGGELFPKFILKPYELVLSKQLGLPFVSTNKTLAVAKHNLDNHFAVVGYLESIESLFVLLTFQFKDRKIEETCSLHRNKITSKIFSSAYDAFKPEVIDVLKLHLTNEFAIYEHTKELHEKHLKRFGLTREQAVRMWHDACDRNGARAQRPI